MNLDLEKQIRLCRVCGKEIDFGKIFCEDCNTLINRQIFDFFSELPSNKDGTLIRPRGKKIYEIIKYYLAAKLGLSDRKRIILKSCTGAGKCCARGTLALTKKGYIPIENIKIGDKVNSFNLNTNNIEEHLVTNKFKFQNEETIHVETGGGYEIEGTLNHRILVMDHKGEFVYRELKDLSRHEYIPINNSERESDYISEISPFKSNFILDKIKTIESSSADVFDITVEKTHNYIANGFVSHNSVLLDMLAFIELTHFPNSLTVIGSISEPVSKIHIERLRDWISNSIFYKYIIGSHESTASKTEIKLAKLNSKVISMPQSPRSRTGWHASLLVIDEIGRIEPQSYYASFSQMATQGGIEIAASTPYLESIIMQNLWYSDNTVSINLEPEECFWIPQSLFTQKEVEYKEGGYSELYEQLYNAKFRSVSNRVIPDDVLLQAISHEDLLSSSGNLVMGIDFGRSIDYTAVVIIDIETGDVKHVETFQDDWQIQFQKIKKIYKDWNPLQIKADSSSMGSVIISDLADLPIEGISMQNDILKKKLVDKLILTFFKNKIRIVADKFPRLVNELSHFVYLDQNHNKVGPIRGGKDDTCDALALALSGMEIPTASLGFPPQNLWSLSQVDDKSTNTLWQLSNI